MNEQIGSHPEKGTDKVVEGIVKNVMERLEAREEQPPAPETEVKARQEAEKVMERYGDAPIQAFVPIIAEREVTDRLKEEPESETRQ